jgi:nucleotide-binding universal stress UspA family protein
MIDRPINHILCAVRGQPKSRKTVTRAIDLALEHEAKLTFCLIIDAEFMGRATPTLTPLGAVFRQLENMGEFSMLILCDRAQRKGVKEVDYLLRRGKIPEQLRRLAEEFEAELMVLGRPIIGIRGSVFKPAEFDVFVESLEKEANIQIDQVIHEEK